VKSSETFDAAGHFLGRVAIALRMIPSTSSRSRPTSGKRGGRVNSLLMSVSAMQSLMYCTSFTCVSRCSRGERGNPKFYGVFADHKRPTRFADITDGTSNTLAIGERPPPDDMEDGWWYSAMCAYALPAVSEPCRGPCVTLHMDSPPGFSGPGCSGPIHFGPGRLENPCDRHHFWSLHQGGANFVFADGSARFISYAAREIVPALATRAGGEVVSLQE